MDRTSAFIVKNERVKAGTGSTMRNDYRLNRYAAYLVAMNGDH